VIAGHKAVLGQEARGFHPARRNCLRAMAEKLSAFTTRSRGFYSWQKSQIEPNTLQASPVTTARLSSPEARGWCLMPSLALRVGLVRALENLSGASRRPANSENTPAIRQFTSNQGWRMRVSVSESSLSSYGLLSTGLSR
jgi:hypothetical protein